MSENGRYSQGSRLVPEQRRQLIADRLRAAGSVSVAAVEAEFGVSPMTARRDLQLLEREGQARRTHGGAVLPGLAPDEDAFQSRIDDAAEVKARLGRAAAALVEDGETVFVDCSTTAFYAVRALIDSDRRATVLTPSVAVMDLIARADAPQVDLLGLAGSLRRLTRSFVGPQTVHAIHAHFADKLLFSVKGIAPGNVMTDANPLEAEVKRAMIDRARDPVLLIDGSKFDRAGLSAIGPVSGVSSVLVGDASREQVRSLAESGVEVNEA
ncbi:MAG: DeoR/GlpR family DNA-binding transcription regulator [Solirubrobacteraceae bacterium]